MLVLVLIGGRHLVEVQVSSVQEGVGVPIRSLLVAEVQRPLLGRGVIAMMAKELLMLPRLRVLVTRVSDRRSAHLLTQFQDVLWDVDSFGLQLLFSHFELILGDLQMIGSSQEVLQVEICLRVLVQDLVLFLGLLRLDGVVHQRVDAQVRLLNLLT